MVKKKVIKIIFSLILCGSLVFLTACQSKEDKRKSKIDQETTRVAKEIDEKLKVKGYTKENISEALLDIYYPQDQFPRVNAQQKAEDKNNFRLIFNDNAPQFFCKGIPEEFRYLTDNCREIEENVFLKDNFDKVPQLQIIIIDFSMYENYEKWKNLKTEHFLDKKRSFIETNNKSQFILVAEKSGYIKTQTKTNSEPQKIENLIPETMEADRYEFMYTVFTKLNIPEN